MFPKISNYCKCGQGCQTLEPIRCLQRKKELIEYTYICALIMEKDKERGNCVMLSADWQGLKCRCFRVFRVLSSLMASADSRGQTSHLHNSFHFRAPDKCFQTCRLSVKSEYFSSSPAECRFGELYQRSSVFLCRREQEGHQITQKKDGGKKAIK